MQAAVKRSAIVLFLDEVSVRRYGQVKRRSRVTVEEHAITACGDLVKRKTTKGWLIRTSSFKNGKFNYGGKAYYIPDANIIAIHRYNKDYPIEDGGKNG